MRADGGTVARDPGLDALRGFLILCVLIGHLPTGLIFAGREASPAALFWSSRTLVYLFHVPAFLGLSCLFVPAWDWKWMGRRALLLLLPYLLWLARPSLFDPIGDVRRLYEAQKALTVANWSWDHSVLWFLPALLACNALVAALGLLPRVAAWGVAIAGAALLWQQQDAVIALHQAGRIPYSLDVALYFAPFFLLMREAYARRQALLKLGPWAWLGVFLVGASLLQAFEPVKLHSDFHLRVDLAQFSVPVTVLGLLGLAMALVGLLLAFTGQPLKGFGWLGRRSLPLYLMHYAFMMDGWERWQAHPGWSSELSLGLLPLALLVVAVAGPSLVSWAARRLSPYARYAGMEG